MKKTLFTVNSFVLGIALLLGACSNEQQEEFLTKETSSMYTESKTHLLEVIKENGSGKESLAITVTGVFDKKTDEVLRFEASDNLLKLLKLKNQEEFDLFIDNQVFRNQIFNSIIGKTNELKANALYADEQKEPEKPFVPNDSGCFSDCYKNFSKGNGRGWCKVDCAIQHTKDILKTLVPLKRDVRIDEFEKEKNITSLLDKFSDEIN